MHGLADVPHRDAGRVEKMRVKPKNDGDVCASGMAHQENLRRIAAITLDMILGPADGHRSVFDERGKPYLGIGCGRGDPSAQALGLGL